MRRFAIRTFTVILLCGSCALASSADSADSDAGNLVVHEWGTFTSLQNGAGETVGGLNVDEEELPAFVHDAMPRALHPDLPRIGSLVWGKGLAVDGRAVTMRLETPVIYFHQVPGAQPVDAEVEVSFQGGVLSQFYPAAQLRTAGAVDEHGHFVVDPLIAASRSTLTWHNVQIGHHSPNPPGGPETQAPVWLAPRAVAAADLYAGWAGEHERFLFYRGLGHLDAPVRVVRDGDHDHFTVHARGAARAVGDTPVAGEAAVPAWWVVDIRADGTTAFRELPAATIGSDGRVAVTAFSADFAEGDYAVANRAGLVARMHAALCGDGLFADEATALLTTWEASYFHSPGLRLFFLVPRTWTDAVLPLRVSAVNGSPMPHTTVRTMVGRIELISRHQRELIADIAAHPGERDDFLWLTKASAQHFGANALPTAQQEREFVHALVNDPEAARGIAIPPAFSAFMALGRFRIALLDDAARNPAVAGLETFMSLNGVYLNP